MDIKLTHSVLKQFLKTTASPQKISKALSLCGPTVDRLERKDNDWIYDIEIITNRVDSASALGVAREASAILPQFDIKAQLINDPYQTTHLPKKLPKKSPVSVTITRPSLVPRFTCISISDVAVKPSPTSTIQLLENVGERGLNNLIDITNELTIKYGQPTHIFDLDRIKGQKMLLRESQAGEKIITLDNQSHKLEGGDIVIEDGEGRLIDLCGIMGGGLSSITPKTKNVLLFVQTYDPKRIRATSLSQQKRTLAAQLFEKQTDPELVMPVLLEGIKLILERAGGKVSSSILDIYPHPPKSNTVDIDLNWLDQFSGVKIPKQSVLSILNHLGFSTLAKENTVECTVPSWRQQDITLRQDLAEEIMRVYGYFRLPSVIPNTDIPAKTTSSDLQIERLAQKTMASMGFTEVYNYSLVSKSLLTKTGYSTKNLFKLNNPLSEDFEYMRPSLVPSLLQNLEFNRGTSNPHIKIFELSNTYHQQAKQQLANEVSTLAFAVQGENFRQVKGYIEHLLKTFGISWSINPKSNEVATFSSEKSGILYLSDKTEVGILGYPQLNISKYFQLPEDIVLCEINFDLINQKASLVKQFTPIPSTSPIIEDLTFTLAPKTHLGPVLTAIKSSSDLINQVTLKDSYQPTSTDSTDAKRPISTINHTFTITYLNPTTQLTAKDIEPVRKKIVTKLNQEFKATLIGNI